MSLPKRSSLKTIALIGSILMAGMVYGVSRMNRTATLSATNNTLFTSNNVTVGSSAYPGDTANAYITDELPGSQQWTYDCGSSECYRSLYKKSSHEETSGVSKARPEDWHCNVVLDSSSCLNVNDDHQYWHAFAAASGDTLVQETIEMGVKYEETINGVRSINHEKGAKCGLMFGAFKGKSRDYTPSCMGSGNNCLACTRSGLAKASHFCEIGENIIEAQGGWSAAQNELGKFAAFFVRDGSILANYAFYTSGSDPAGSNSKPYNCYCSGSGSSWTCSPCNGGDYNPSTDVCTTGGGPGPTEFMIPSLSDAN